MGGGAMSSGRRRGIGSFSMRGAKILKQSDSECVVTENALFLTTYVALNYHLVTLIMFKILPPWPPVSCSEVPMHLRHIRPTVKVQTMNLRVILR